MELAHRVFEDDTKFSFIQYSMAGLPFSPGAGTLVTVTSRFIVFYEFIIQFDKLIYI